MRGSMTAGVERAMLAAANRCALAGILVRLGLALHVPFQPLGQGIERGHRGLSS